MTEYPYGRQGYPHCYHKETAVITQLEGSAETLDNQFSITGNTLYLYEAPTDSNPKHGYFSVWKVMDDSPHGNTYEQVRSIEGDDQMCYEQFLEER